MLSHVIIAELIIFSEHLNLRPPICHHHMRITYGACHYRETVYTLPENLHSLPPCHYHMRITIGACHKSGTANSSRAPAFAPSLSLSHVHHKRCMPHSWNCFIPYQGTCIHCLHFIIIKASQTVYIKIVESSILSKHLHSILPCHHHMRITNDACHYMCIELLMNSRAPNSLPHCHHHEDVLL